MLPTFLMVGTAKCGTTSICSLIDEHPQGFVSDPKEPHYFSNLVMYDERRSWYESLFEDAEDGMVAGEGSVSYTLPSRIDFVAPRIKSAIPDCRLILTARHPIDRIESDWKMRTVEGRDTRSISNDVQRWVEMVRLGLYWDNLSVYRELFDDEQILVVFLEDFAEEPLREMRRVYDHIGVDPEFVPDDLGESRNTAEDRRRAVAVSDVATVLPGVRRLDPLIPDRIVELGKALLARRERYNPNVEWDDNVLREVKKVFREDSRELLEYCGKEASFWQFG